MHDLREFFSIEAELSKFPIVFKNHVIGNVVGQFISLVQLDFLHTPSPQFHR